jgi:hypothetical protein
MGAWGKNWALELRNRQAKSDYGMRLSFPLFFFLPFPILDTTGGYQRWGNFFFLFFFLWSADMMYSRWPGKLERILRFFQRTDG